MAHLTQADWDAHAAAINEFAEDAFQQLITWRTNITNLSEHGEDDVNRTRDITLKGLVLYNYFRSWPTNKPDVAGEIDNESVLIYFNSKYLADEGYINSDGQFDFQPVTDRFWVNGLQYKASGESQAAQSNDQPLLHFVIMKREELNSHENKY